VTPLQRIALGLVVVVGSAYFPAHPHPAWQHYDALPDPIGWLLVLWGLWPLRRLDASFDLPAWLAVLAALVSVPLWLPVLRHHLDASGEWAASMPQTLCCLLLARSIGRLAALQQPRDEYAARRFGLLSWGFALLIVLPVLALGGRLRALENPTLLVSAVVNVAFIVFLFRVHRRAWLGGVASGRL
jgi:hypothetical protein